MCARARVSCLLGVGGGGEQSGTPTASPESPAWKREGGSLVSLFSPSVLRRGKVNQKICWPDGGAPWPGGALGSRHCEVRPVLQQLPRRLRLGFVCVQGRVGTFLLAPHRELLQSHTHKRTHPSPFPCTPFSIRSPGARSSPGQFTFQRAASSADLSGRPARPSCSGQPGTALSPGALRSQAPRCSVPGPPAPAVSREVPAGALAQTLSRVPLP